MPAGVIDPKFDDGLLISPKNGGEHRQKTEVVGVVWTGNRGL